MKTLLCIGEGLGNVVQVLPLVRALDYNGIEVSILNLSSIPDKDAEWLFSKYATLHTGDNFSKYIYRIELATTKDNRNRGERFQIPRVNSSRYQFIYSPTINEVDVYLGIIPELSLGLPEDNPYDVEVGDLLDLDEYYDYCIHNGCSLVNPKQWERKKYPHMEQLAQYLHASGKSVACIGAPHEYVAGENRTGLSLQETASIIKSSKHYIANDTGTYHLASAMKTSGVVIFTATSVYKNWHPEFHRTVDVVTSEIDCQPCQYTTNWGLCTEDSHHKWKCRDVDFYKVLGKFKV
jgi:hypothetical protein